MGVEPFLEEAAGIVAAFRGALKSKRRIFWFNLDVPGSGFAVIVPSISSVQRQRRKRVLLR